MSLEPDESELIEDDDWPPPAEPPPARRRVRILIEGDASDPYLIRTTTRLLLGGAAEGSDLFVQRLRKWQTETDNLGQAIYSESPDETDGERLRYAMIGLLARGPVVASSALTYALGASELAFGVVSRLLSPVANSRAMRPVTRRYDGLAARGEQVLEYWIDRGRAAEQRSRALARRAADQGVDEALDVAIGQLADDESVRELVTQQGMGMADEVVDAVRVRTARADASLERRVRGLFRRR
jgi:hypothetical protein